MKKKYFEMFMLSHKIQRQINKIKQTNDKKKKTVTKEQVRNRRKRK